MALVNTVRGPVDSADLGQTLMHEHLVNVTTEIAQDQPSLSLPARRGEVLSLVVDQLSQARGGGIRTIVDASAYGHGRDIRLAREANELVDVHVIVATGLYTFDALPRFFQHRTAPPDSPDPMTEVFVADITTGIAGIGVRAGIIKCATDAPGVTPSIDRILRAVAAAHRETGVPITTHTSSAHQNGLDQQRIFEAEGVDLRRVVIGHCGDTADLDYLRALLDRGSYIGADRFGMYLPGRPTMAERVATVAQLCHLGYAGQIMLSHDKTIYTDWFIPGQEPHAEQWRWTHITSEVVPALLAAGVSEHDIHQMLVENPRCLFEQTEAY